jgi:hypothetical protein
MSARHRQAERRRREHELLKKQIVGDRSAVLADIESTIDRVMLSTPGAVALSSTVERPNLLTRGLKK